MTASVECCVTGQGTREPGRDAFLTIRIGQFHTGTPNLSALLHGNVGCTTCAWNQPTQLSEVASRAEKKRREGIWATEQKLGRQEGHLVLKS